MGAHSNGQPQIVQRFVVGTLGIPDRPGRGEKEKEWTDCAADNLRLVGIEDGERCKTVALDPGKWWEMVMEGGRMFMATWRKDEERAAEFRRNKREAEEADKIPIASVVTAGQLRRFREALIGPFPSPLPQLTLGQWSYH